MTADDSDHRRIQSGVSAPLLSAALVVSIALCAITWRSLDSFWHEFVARWCIPLSERADPRESD